MSKRDLVLTKPLMNAAGSLGFAPDARQLAPWDAFGAFVTNHLSRRPRKPAIRPAVLDFPGGILLHSGLPNPGFDAAIKQYAAAWKRSQLPVVVHLMADRPEETATMVHRLEGIEGVMAAELGFAPQLADEIIVLAVEMSLGELPLVPSLPFEQLLRLGPRLADLGVAAVSLAPPRGLLPRPSPQRGDPVEFISGRLFGPALFAHSLLAVRDAVRSRIPVIGGCGVYSQDDAETMLATGALAVQVDAALWQGSFSRAAGRF